MTLSQISTFEKYNDTISVNVFGLELELNSKSKFSIVPLRICKEKREKRINLLQIQNRYFPSENIYEDIDDKEDDSQIKYNFCWIKSLSRLLNTITKSSRQKYLCDRCLCYFSSQEKLTDDDLHCSYLNECKAEFPSYSHIEFKNFLYKEKVPFIVHADFESLLQPIKDAKKKSSKTI